MYLYSPKDGGFYRKDIHGTSLPNEGVEITDEDHAILMNGQSIGKVIRQDKNNRPILGDPVVVSASIKEITKLKFIEWCEMNGKLDTLIVLLEGDQLLKFKWDAATCLQVDHPLVIGNAAAFGDPQVVFNEIG